MTTRIAHSASQALIVTLLVSLTACHGVPGAKPDPVSESEYPQVALQGSLRNKVFVGRPIVIDAGDAPLKVSVPVRYKKRSQIDVQYRFIFLDDRGAPVGPEMDWRWTQLPGRTQVYLEAAAMKMDADDWRLEIRPDADLK